MRFTEHVLFGCRGGVLQLTRTTVALGVAYMALATLGVAAMSAMVKLTNRAIPTQELVFWRALFSLVMILPLVLRARHHLIVTAKKTLLLRSVLGFVAMLLFFFSINRLSLAEASILVKLQPVWIALLAPLVVGDKPDRRVIGSLMVSLIGVALVLGPGLTTRVFSIAGFAALSASFLSALAHLEIRRLGRTEHPDVVVLNFTVLLLLFSGLSSAPVAIMPEREHWPFLVGLGFFATIGQFFMTKAYKTASAPTVATAGYLAIPVAALIDWLVFDTTPALWTIAGGGFIVLSGVILTQELPSRFFRRVKNVTSRED